LARRWVGRLTALALAIVLLLLGSAGEDLFWGFQIEFLGATAAGGFALLFFLAEPPLRPALLAAGAVLLVVAVATSGVGLVFTLVAGALAVVNPRRRQMLVPVAIALAVYGIWLLLSHGGNGVVGGGIGFALSSPEETFAFVRTGVADAVGAVSGFGPEVGFVLAVGLVVGVIFHLLSRHKLNEALVMGATGLVAQYALAALARASLGTQAAAASRYRYVGAFFLLLAVAGLAGWLWRSRRLTGRTLLPVAVVLVMAIASNALQLLSWREFFQVRATEARADLQLVTQFAGTPAVPADTARNSMDFLGNIPPPATLLPILQAYGSPLDDPLVSAVPIPDAIRQAVLFNLVEPALTIEPAAQLPAALLAPVIEAHSGAEVVADAPCVRATPNSNDPHLRLSLPGGAQLALVGRAHDETQLFLSLSDKFYETASVRFNLGPGGISTVKLPDIGSTVWHVRLDPSVSGPLRICAVGSAP
jgi:hypothetical protein